MSKPERNREEDVETIQTHKRNHMGISIFAAKLIFRGRVFNAWLRLLESNEDHQKLV